MTYLPDYLLPLFTCLTLSRALFFMFFSNTVYRYLYIYIYIYIYPIYIYICNMRASTRGHLILPHSAFGPRQTTSELQNTPSDAHRQTVLPQNSLSQTFGMTCGCSCLDKPNKIFIILHLGNSRSSSGSLEDRT